MADTPQIKTPEEIIGKMIETFLAKSKVVNDLNPGSVVLSIFEAFGRAGFRSSGDMLAMASSLSVDRASEDALKALAIDRKVPIYSATASTGLVSIIDTSFDKIQTKIYGGRPAPSAGSRIIYVNDAQAFQAIGQLYIGRGTNNVEGPLSYGTDSFIDPDDNISKTGIVSKNGGAYYAIFLDAASATVKFHNFGETVVLAQGGNRAIAVNTIVQTAQGVSTESVQFQTTSPATLLDGENQIDNVPVVASKFGTIGNVSRGAIVEVVGLSFAARAFNNLPITNARPDDTNESLRERIKAYEQARTKGTEDAIIQASINVFSSEDLKRVTSATIKRTAGTEQILIFDDGSGYEPIDSGVGIEQIIDQALGGEEEFQLKNPMVVRATATTINSSPFTLIGGEILTVEIEGVGTYSHTFAASDFRTYNAADAFEVAASINSASPALPFLARTAAGGTQVSITPRTGQNIRVSGGGANAALGFPTNRIYSARLYKNDEPIYLEGFSASVLTASQSVWTSVVSGDTISYLVDSTTPITIQILDSDFQKYGSGLVMSSSTSLSVWASVLNDKLPGILTEVVGDKLQMSSRSGATNNAAIEIYTGPTSADAIGSAMFGQSSPSVSAVGQGSDYQLNLKTGQLQLDIPLEPGDSITAGSEFTRAKLETGELSNTTSFGSDIQIFAVIDGAAAFVPTYIDFVSAINFGNASGGLQDVTVTPVSNEAALGAFQDVKPGDWLVMWKDGTDSFSLNANNLGRFRVAAIAAGAPKNTITIQNPTGVAGAVVLPTSSRFLIVRSEEPMQYVNIASGVYTRAQLRDQLNQALVGIEASVVESKVRVESKSYDDAVSEIFFAAVSVSADSVGFKPGKYIAVPSHAGFVAPAKEDMLGMPTFKILRSANSTPANTIDDDGQAGDPYSVSGEKSYLRAGGTRNELIQYKKPYDIRDALAPELQNYIYGSSNQDVVEQVADYNTTTLRLEPFRRGLAKPYALNDEFILRQGLGFDVADKVSFVIDKDTSAKSFATSVSRRVSVGPSPTSTQMTLNDDEGVLDLNDPQVFRDFNFNNFKFWTQAKLTEQSMSFKYADFGPSGSRSGISLRYPQDGGLSHSHEINQGPITDIAITLESGVARTANWDDTTSFVVTVNAPVGNRQTAIYSWAAGTAPNFPAAGVVIGDIANIGPLTSFLPSNKGIYKITAVSATSITIEGPAGVFQAEPGTVAITNIVYPSPATETLAYGFGRAQVTTSAPHGLADGQQVGISNVDYTDYNSVSEVQNATTSQFEYDPDLSINGGAVTAVKISVQNPWSASSYKVGDFVSEAGIYYVCLIDNLGFGTATPGYWEVVPSAPSQTILRRYVTTDPHNMVAGNKYKGSNIPAPFASLNGIETVVLVTTPNEFYSAIDPVGGETNTLTVAIAQGRADQQPTAIYGTLSKSLNADDNLKIYPISATQASIKAYIEDSANGLTSFIATPVTAPTPGAAMVATIDAGSGRYYSSGGSVSITIEPFYGEYDRTITLPSAPPFSKGAIITLARGSAPTAYTLQDDINAQPLQVLSVTGTKIIVRSLKRLSKPTEGAVTESGWTWTAIQNVIGFGSAESFIKTSDLSSSPPPLNFTLKKALVDLAAGDIGYLIAANAEHLSRFWGRLAVTGVSNVSSVGSGQTESIWQVRTNTFGSAGGVQLSGGRANEHAAAVSGSGQTRSGQPGFDVARDLRLGMVAPHFVKAANTIVRDKINQITNLTEIALIGNNAAVIKGEGSFSVERANVNFASGQDIKIEKHGQFLAFQQVAGPSLNLSGWANASITGDTAPGTRLITNVSSIAGIFVGQEITGTGIPARARITFVDEGMILIDTNATASGTTVALTVKKPPVQEGDWVRIRSKANYVNLTTSDTWSRTSNVITVNKTAHGFAKGNQVTFVNTPFDGTYELTSTTANTMLFAKAGANQGSTAFAQTARALQSPALNDQKSGALTTWTRTSSVVTATIAGGTHGYVVGDRVAIAGSGGTISIDGSWILSSVTGTTVSFAQTAADEGPVSSTGSIISNSPFSASNRGIYKVVRVYGDAFWVENANGVEQAIESLPAGYLSFYSHDSVQSGDLIRISGDILGQENVGSYYVNEESSVPPANPWVASISLTPPADEFNSSVSYPVGAIVQFAGNVYVSTIANPAPSVQPPSSNYWQQYSGFTSKASVQLGVQSPNFTMVEKAPLVLYKQVVGTGASEVGVDFSFISVSTPNLIDRIDNSFGGYIQAEGKLALDTGTKLGLDGYRYSGGLIKELYKVIYGDPTDPALAGIRAAGADIDIQPPIRRRIKLSATIRVKTGIPSGDVIEAVKNAIFSYVNSLGVGKALSISAAAAEAQEVSGIVTVEITPVAPTVSVNGLITVSIGEVARIIDIDSDILVTLVGG